jgi:hypothetical protein
MMYIIDNEIYAIFTNYIVETDVYKLVRFISHKGCWKVRTLMQQNE